MFEEAVSKSLFDAGVLYEETDGTVKRADWFVEDVERVHATLSEMGDAERADHLDSRLDDEVADLFDGDEAHALPELLALQDALDSGGSRPVLWAAVMLNQYRPSLPPGDGTPDYFLPVHGDRLPTLLKLSSEAIVYVWRHECPPCELVRSDLEGLIDPEAIDRPLYAVYGPDAPELLQEMYDVFGGPTVLFCVGDRVDMRIQGPQHPKVFHRALDMEAEPLVREYEEFIERANEESEGGGREEFEGRVDEG
jgi:hypothetical protein